MDQDDLSAAIALIAAILAIYYIFFRSKDATNGSIDNSNNNPAAAVVNAATIREKKRTTWQNDSHLSIELIRFKKKHLINPGQDIVVLSLFEVCFFNYVVAVSC